MFCVQYMWIGKRSYVTVSGNRAVATCSRYRSRWSGAWWPFSDCVALTPCSGGIFYGSFTVNWGVDYTLTLDNFIKLFGRDE